MVQVMRKWRESQAKSVGETLRRLPGFPIWTEAWVSKTKHAEQMKGVAAWKADFLTKNFELYEAFRTFLGDTLMNAWLREVREFPESRRKLE